MPTIENVTTFNMPDLIKSIFSLPALVQKVHTPVLGEKLQKARILPEPSTP